MVAVHQEHAGLLADQPKEGALEQVGLGEGRRRDRPDLVDAEVVADADMEVGALRRGRLQRAGVEVRMAALRAFRVGVALNCEDEGRAWRALRGKAALRSGGERSPAGL